MGRILLDTSKKVYVTKFFEAVICHSCHSSHAMYFWMEGDAEDSTVQGSEDRQIKLISRKVSRKGKVIQKRKLSPRQCESSINTVAGQLVSSENITELVDVWDKYR